MTDLGGKAMLHPIRHDLIDRFSHRDQGETAVQPPFSYKDSGSAQIIAGDPGSEDNFMVSGKKISDMKL